VVNQLNLALPIAAVSTVTVEGQMVIEVCRDQNTCRVLD
jgi:hypothetical protein